MLTADGVSIASLIVASVGTIFAGLAAYFAWLAPSKKDLQRVEANTAETADRLEKVRSHIARVDDRQNEQHNADLIRERARRISIHVAGESDISGNSMTLTFTLKDPNVVLLQIELANEIGSSFGHAECASVAPNQFTAAFDIDVVRTWFESATKIDIYARRVLTIRARLLFGKLPAERDIPVFLKKDTVPLFKLEGSG